MVAPLVKLDEGCFASRTTLGRVLFVQCSFHTPDGIVDALYIDGFPSSSYMNHGETWRCKLLGSLVSNQVIGRIPSYAR